MINSLALENYRGFQGYRVSGLRRVNLLVGKNNCGKSSLLEGVHLLATGGDPWVIQRIAWRRGEVIYLDGDRERYRRDMFPDATHFFFGHELKPGSRLSIASENGLGELTLEVIHSEESESQPRLFEEADDVRPMFGLKIKSLHGTSGRELAPIPLAETGALAVEAFYRVRRPSRPIEDGLGPVHFVAVDSLGSDFMGAMWDKALAEKREHEVAQAMQILAPDLEDIVFQTGERSARLSAPGNVLVGFKGGGRRVPLGSLGDGMRRLLALSLALIRCERGVLLIDEIDTGLHYSIMGDMWRLVIEAARNDIQVFATTHSLDCLRGLSWICEARPDLADEVSVQKIDPGLSESVPLDGEQIRIACEQEIEVR